MSALDIIIIIIISLFLGRGIWTGFIRQIASVAALVIGFIIAGRFYGESANLVFPFIRNQQAGFFVAYILLFLLSFAVVILTGILIKKVMKISLLGWFDTFLGGVFGLFKGVFVSCLVFMGLALFISGASTFFSNSFFYPYLESSSNFVISIIKDEEIRHGLLPQKPAISSIFSNTIEFGKKIGGEAN